MYYCFIIVFFSIVTKLIMIIIIAVFFYIIALLLFVFLSLVMPRWMRLRATQCTARSRVPSLGLMPRSRVLSGRSGFLQQFKDMRMRQTGLGLNWPLNGCWSCPGWNPAFARRQLGEAPATPATLNAGVGCRKQNRRKPVWLINRILVLR